MNLTQTTVDNFQAGHGTATATAQPIVAASYARKAYKGVTIRCLTGTGTVFVGPSTVTTQNGYELPAGKELLVPVEDPSKVFVVGSGDYSWLSV